jgi:serine protease AprX
MPRSAKVRGGAAIALVLCLLLPAGAGQASAEHTSNGVHIQPGLLASLTARPGPVILTWDKHVTTRQQVTDYLRAHGLSGEAFSTLPMAVSCAATAEDVLTLSHTPGAVSVYGDEQMVPTVRTEARLEGAGPVRAPSGVPGATGADVGIAVFDTGIDATHPDLELGRKTVTNVRVVFSHRDVYGPNGDPCLPNQFQEGVSDSENVSGHGTHIAGVAAGDGTASGGQVTGVAPGADLIGLSLVEQSTPEHLSDISLSLIRFLGGVNYVTNRSLSGDPTFAKVALLGWTAKGLYDPWHPHSTAMIELHEFGISPVIPVGNGGNTSSKCDAETTCHFNPLAVGDYVIGVGATRQTAAGPVLADFSSGGDPEPVLARDETLVRYQPMVVAPGTNILGARRVGLATYAGSPGTPYPLAGQGAGAGDDPTNLRYQAMTGTSVAAAQVAGTIALMQQAARDAKGCFLSADQVQEILRQTAAPMAGYASWQVGYGAVDPAAAVAAARSTPRIWSPDTWNCPG